MKQPYLGKKVLELRKLKGLTQSELVEKCNITVRTLQRIESGEVTPRAFTIKSIFEALEYDVYAVSNTRVHKFNRIKYNFLERLEKTFQYIMNLFNLKTNTMKKLKILSISTILMFALFVSISYSANGQNRLQKKLIGTWQLCKPDGTIDKNVYGFTNNSRIKIITKESFSGIAFNSSNNNTIGHFWGTYILEKGKLSEKIKHTSPNYSGWIGTTISFSVRVKKDYMYVTGLGSGINEVWKKIKD